MDTASLILDFHDPGNTVFPFRRRHPADEVVAREGGV
jgi:hypothetical protein